MTVWLPMPSAEVVKAVVPAESNGTWASTAVPSWKVTIPVGMAEFPGDDATVAVNATGWPSPEGFGDAASEVVEAFAWTFWTRAAERLPPPPGANVAVTKWLAAGSAAVTDACPAPSRGTVPRTIVVLCRSSGPATK